VSHNACKQKDERKLSKRYWHPGRTTDSTQLTSMTGFIWALRGPDTNTCSQEPFLKRKRSALCRNKHSVVCRCAIWVSIKWGMKERERMDGKTDVVDPTQLGQTLNFTTAAISRRVSEPAEHTSEPQASHYVEGWGAPLPDRLSMKTTAAGRPGTRII